ncbi:MAG: leucine-rich repeat protein [Clostridia bacterium]|nr:leucine-rich repeat protein [Clostridia bacterium]
MKTTVKKSVSFLLSLLMLFSVFCAVPITASASIEDEEDAEIIESGECGLYVSWYLNSLGTLYLEGDGGTYDYPADKTSPFWRDTRIKKIVVREGVTYLGRMIFRELPNLTEVVLEEGLKEMEFGIFTDSKSLTELELPSTFQRFTTVAPFYRSGIKKLTFKGNKLTTNTESGYAWDRFLSNVEIYIPVPFTLNGTVLSTYEEAAGVFNHDGNSVYFVNDNATVKWKNYDGAVLETDENATQGEIPTYDGETPTRPSDAANAYYFTGWDPEPFAVIGDMTYTATYGSFGKASYIDENGEEQSVFARPLTGTETELSGGWYVTDQNLKYSETLTFNSNTNLILADGATLEVADGAFVACRENLNIYCQKGKTGVLKADMSIGAGITVYGGNITSSSYTASLTDIKIYGGAVNANYVFLPYGNISIYGGNTNIGYGLSVEYDITLGYKNPTDSIYIKEFSKTDADVKIVAGQSFANADDLSQIYTGTSAPADLAGKTLVPYAHNPITYVSNAFGTVTGAGEADFGDEVALIVTPNVGCATETVTVTDAAGREIPVADGKFIMPDSAVTVTAAFSQLKYTVSWEIGGVIAETDDNVLYGSAPEYNGDPVADYFDGTTHYLYSGWSDGANTYAPNELPAVTGNVTYAATYTSQAAHAYGEPDWSWTEDKTAAAVTFACAAEGCGHSETVQAVITRELRGDKVISTASAVFCGESYTDKIAEDYGGGVLIDFTPGEYGVASADRYLVQNGETVNISFRPFDGYDLYGYSFSEYDTQGNTISSGSTSYTYMNSSHTYAYTVSLRNATDGTITITPDFRRVSGVTDATGGLLTFHRTYTGAAVSTGFVGEAVFVFPKNYIGSGEEGSKIESITVTDENGNAVDTELSDYGWAQFTMPDSKVSVNAVISGLKYTVYQEYDPIRDHGFIRHITGNTLSAGETYQGQVESYYPYILTGLYAKDADNNVVDLIADGSYDARTGIVSFTMPAKSLTLYRTHEEMANMHAIRLDEASQDLSKGYISASTHYDYYGAAADEEVTLKAEFINENYGLSKLFYVDENGVEVNLMPFYNRADGTFTFTMPDSDITLYYRFSEYRTVTVNEYDNSFSITGFAGETTEFEIYINDYAKEHAKLDATYFYYYDGNNDYKELDANWDPETGMGTFVMPDEDIRLHIQYMYYRDVPVGAFYHGTVTADKEKAIDGEIVTYTVHPDDGWFVTALGQRMSQYYADGVQDENDENIWYVTMPWGWSGERSLWANFEEATDWHIVTIRDSEHGSVSFERSGARAGKTVDLVVTPDEGYQLDALVVRDGGNNEITLIGTTFTMPDSDVTVTATFKEAHVYGKPVWMWGDNYSSAAVKFSCADCGDVQIVDASVVSRQTDATHFAAGKIVYTATALFDGETFSDVKEVAIPQIAHTPGAAVIENKVAATFDKEGGYDTVVYCSICGEELSREHTVIEKLTPDPTDPTDPDKGLCKYCGQDHSGSFWQRIVGFFHAILYFILHLFGKI